MAQSSQYSPPRREAGEEIDPHRSILGVPSQTFIVPRFSPEGRAQSGGQPIEGPAQVNKYKARILESMQSRGRLMPGFVMTTNGPVKVAEAKTTLRKVAAVKKAPETVKPKKPAKSARKAEPVQYEAPEPEIEPKPEYDTAEIMQQIRRQANSKDERTGFSVVFSIDSGKIKSVADAVLETENALLLVYADQDAVSYLPEAGSKLTIILPDNREQRVYFLGEQFEWHDSRQQLLVYIKRKDREEVE